MTKAFAYALLIWNIVLTGLVAWVLARTGAGPSDTPPPAEEEAPARAASASDSTTAAASRIAFFRMDSLRNGYEMIKEQNTRFIAEGRRLEAGLQAEQAKARQRYQELMAKDQTYSTKAELERDEQELRSLMEKLQGMQTDGEERLARLEAEMLKEIGQELEDYLKEYNATAGYDYI
ncbi:MAG: OmpH family outer membrane protein, partial [Flavobacteriales bacterium]